MTGSNPISEPTFISKSDHWVSDGLGDDFHTWHHSRPVFISAQTGSGKNHFIVEKLIPYAIEQGRQVFIFSNRIALATQQKRIILQKLSMPNIYSDDELERRTEFGPVTIANYQSAFKILNPYGYNYSIATSFYDTPYRTGYAVFDEAHFFLSDSLFNAYTERIFQRLLSFFSGFIRIYMSATPDRILPLINALELSNPRKNNVTPYDLRHPISFSEDKQSVQVYTFQRNYENYNIQFFTDFEQLYKRITASKANDKWLCFVNSRHRQQTISATLKAKNEKLQITCFDQTKKSNEKLWSSLVQGQIPGHIFLTTIALDNGINLTDKALHNVVVEGLDKVSVLQMIGRKRRADGERVNLFIHAPSEAEVKQQLLYVGDLLNFIGDFFSNPRDFLEQKWSVFYDRYRNLFYIDSAQELNCNRFAATELYNLQKFFSALLFQIQDAKTASEKLAIYPKMVLEWLGLSCDIKWIHESEIKSAIDGLILLLEEYQTSGIPEEMHVEFFKTFKKYADIIGASPIKSDPRSGPSITSKFLEEYQKELQAKYYIDGKGTWIVHKKPL